MLLYIYYSMYLYTYADRHDCIINRDNALLQIFKNYENSHSKAIFL